MESGIVKFEFIPLIVFTWKIAYLISRYIQVPELPTTVYILNFLDDVAT